MPPLVEHILFQRDKWTKLFTAALRPSVEQYMTDGAGVAVSTAEALGIVGAFDVKNPKVAEFIDKYTFERITDITETSAERYRAILAEALGKGETGAEIRDRILNDPILGEKASKARAEMIARTETARAQIEGNRLAVVEANAQAEADGVAAPFEKYEFMPSPDCCEECNARAGMTADLGGDLELPHPNCRCDWQVQISEAYKP
jgi:hypothetical protein